MTQTKEEIRQYNKEYKKKNKEKIKEYREKNKEKTKEYREKNKEKAKEYGKKYRENNREKLKNYDKTPKRIKSSRIISWRKQGIKSVNYNEIYERYIHTEFCEVCNIELTDGKPNTHRTRNLDHQHSSGEIRNILCRRCNTQRSTIDLNHMYVLQELHRYFRRTEI